MSQSCTTADPCYPTVTDDSYLTDIIADTFSYQIYDDSSRFADWEAWVDDSDNSAQLWETLNKDIFDGYVLKIQCNASEATTPAYSACCLRAESNGGFCLENGTDGSSFTMFSITQSDFDSWGASPAALTTNHSSWALDPDDSDTVIGFQYFYCDEAANDDFTCYKFNPMEDQQSDGAPRFDNSGDSIIYYFYDAGTDANTSSVVTLESVSADDGAQMLLTGAAAFAAILMSF